MDKLLDDVNVALEKARGLGVQGSEELPEKLTDEQKQQAAEAIKNVSVEIYTGKEDTTLRRMVVKIDVQAPADASGGAQSGTLSLDFSLLDLNEEQEIAEPSGAKPFDELLGQLGGLGLGGAGGAGGPAARARAAARARRRAAARRRTTSRSTPTASRRPAATTPRSPSAQSFSRRSRVSSAPPWPRLPSRASTCAASCSAARAGRTCSSRSSRSRSSLELTHASATIIFGASALGVIPTAALMGRATEELAARSGPGIGGFLNVTFGNAPELIIAFFALREGLQEVVKASLVGSILGNILLVMGAAMLVGGLKRERQYFDRTAASVQSLMLLLAGVALILPAIFELVIGGGLPSPTDEAVQFPADLEKMSIGVAIVLLGTYVGRAALLAAHAQGPVQPRARRRGPRRRALVGAQGRHHARARRRRGRRDVRDPRRLDHRGLASRSACRRSSSA